MSDLTATREIVQRALAEELVGPQSDAPRGMPLDLSTRVRFDSWEAVAGPYHCSKTLQEVLSDTEPVRRYGVGVLHPAHVADSPLQVVVPGLEKTSGEVPPDAGGGPSEDSGSVAADGDDLDLSLANSWEQSTVGVSFRADLPAGSGLRVVASFGAYAPIEVVVGDATPRWWVRRPVKAVGYFSAAGLTEHQGRRIIAPDVWTVEGVDPSTLELRAFSRLIDGQRLITLTVTNRSSGRGSAHCLFQAGLTVLAEQGAAILPYRERRGNRVVDREEQSIALLYRRHQTFGIGHGCAADWEREPGDAVTELRGVCLPQYEAPSVTPDIRARDNSVLKVDMRLLAGDDDTAAADQVEELLASYEEWIARRREERVNLPQELQPAADDHLQQCDLALNRMRDGWSLVRTDPLIRKAFRLANAAMLAQQARSSAELRRTSVDANGLIKVEGLPPDGSLSPDRGFWRPFQIAFFLAALKSTALGDDAERKTIELIFFPTGGGKTEAYLGLAAFSMLLRRLRATGGPDLGPQPSSAITGGAGTDVLMRYTLRLLTAQQFLRAASLICALEQLRQDDQNLGTAEFSVGIWLGGDTTPNTHKQAVETWNALARDPANASNKFLLLQCPWCAATMGPTQEQQQHRRGRGRGQQPTVPGYIKQRDVVRLACPDRKCAFARGLPLYVVDEDIYAKRPTLVIGTVDKFAMLAWRDKARAIFGINGNGDRELAPPNLIIQDEFHLISGPLGSMVGLYEGVIEDLCTDHRQSEPTLPKIVASTATIRRYEEQALAVYGRQTVRLFPPQGLDVQDAFFAVWARHPATGELLPGRRYVGVHAPSLGSTQSVQVRVGASLLQAPLLLASAEEQDPWWTNLWFFNSLRELGNTLSLMQSDIPDYIVGVRLRDKLTAVRFPGSPLELTSRRRDDEIPRAIQQLERKRVPTTGRDKDARGAVSVCLASSIVEVGVDIERLSLMTIVGQPKTTAQYIQVSGRVGRRWWERPGLVVTLYGAAKPRDRSHYERFRSYHEKLYAQVEPTSVTPFAKPVMQRALRAALVAYVRMYGPEGSKPWPYPQELAERGSALLLARLRRVDASEMGAATELLALAAREWQHWGRAEWDGNYLTGDPLNGLMRFPGTAEPPTPSWEIPTSMRNVDAECRTSVTVAYHEDRALEVSE
ncbi:helicase [Ornithinimicrobium avium]|uniref:Helicase n=1 Tax=Ornithinimicrobium avium TaxID=2283195 RepID=A0A345NP34_9MICO|nr:helicase [Ornithinimicrobium avium]